MDTTDRGTSAPASLPPEELKRIEDALYRAVLARVLRGVAVGALIVFGSLALVGWLTWRTAQRRLITGAVAVLQSDTTLRSGLLSSLQLDSAAFARLLDSLQVLSLDPSGAAADPGLRRLIDELFEGQGVSPPPAAMPPRRPTSPRH